MNSGNICRCEAMQGQYQAFRNPPVHCSTSRVKRGPCSEAIPVQRCNALVPCRFASCVAHKASRVNIARSASPTNVSQHRPRQHTCSYPSSAAAFESSKPTTVDDRGDYACFLGLHVNLPPPVSYLPTYDKRINRIAMALASCESTVAVAEVPCTEKSVKTRSQRQAVKEVRRQHFHPLTDSNLALTCLDLTHTRF